MMVTSRFGPTCGALLSLLIASTVAAQDTDRPTPPPPEPGQIESPALEGPTTNLEPIPQNPSRSSSSNTSAVANDNNNVAVAVTRHDALQTTDARSIVKSRVYAPKEPPAIIAERPTGARPASRSIWVPGYWDWDPVQGEYYWIGGVWQTPPAGTVWIGSRWARDDRGWYRKMGFWSKRRSAEMVETAYQKVALPAWRMTGPPADHPADQPGPAPSPDGFYVPGHYAPDGDQVRWKPGFWTSSQPGWDWIPARWVRRPGGWEFRAGHWVREPGAALEPVAERRRTVNGDVVVTDPPALPPVPAETEDERDVIAGSRRTVRPLDEPSFVVVPEPSYYVIRRPGSYPYGPGGVIVPAAVPPFVRDILNRVLP